MTHFALEIGQGMQLDEAQLRTLELAGFLHDVGKIGVPESILRKAGPLTDAEYEIVKEHSRIGNGIVQNIEGAGEIAEIVLHHHERWDGKGYPDGLHGEEPTLLSRILAVADAFDAMCSRRPYRDRLSLEKGAFGPSVKRPARNSIRASPRPSSTPSKRAGSSPAAHEGRRRMRPRREAGGDLPERRANAS